ncbi:cytochrome P450, partial [Streptomyces sp. ST2-7A]|uniref:cytochrome P450 n=1 Tax=Streptomyces sp. ST2-7A TaxID=2907214 RepID=UPI001F43F947
MHLASHPFLFLLLALGRRAPVRRLGGTVIVHGTRACREALTRLSLDRAGEGTTGAVARELVGSGALFDESGGEHRAGRRHLADRLGTAGIERTRALRREVLCRRLAPLAQGGEVDVVDLARELAGVSAASLLDHDGDPRRLADAALAAAADAVRAHLPSPWPLAGRRAVARARRSADRLADLLDGSAPTDPARTGAVPLGTLSPDTTEAVDEAVDPVPGATGRASLRALDSRSSGTGSGVAGGNAAGPTTPARAGTCPIAGGPAPDLALRATMATAAVATTVALLPRAVARCADARLWAWADDPDDRAALAGEALRVVAPSPVLPRRAAAPGVVDGRPVPAGARLLLVVRHGALAHR